MSSSQSKRKRAVKSVTMPSSSTRQEFRDLLHTHASENSPEVDLVDDDYVDIREEEGDPSIGEDDEIFPTNENAREEVANEVRAAKSKSKKIQKRAEFWKHFKQIKDNNGDTARTECIYCKKSYAENSSKNGTRNLSKHRDSCVENPENKSKELPRDDDGKHIGHISAKEWAIIEVIVSFLKEFYDFTNTVSGSSYVTVSNVYLYIGHIVSLLNQAVENSDPICQSMAVQMKKKCEKYWDEVEKLNLFIFVGIMLDPLYKFNGLKLALQRLYGEEKGLELATKLRSSAKEIFDEYRNLYAPSSSSAGSVGTGTGSGPLAGTSIGVGGRPCFWRDVTSDLIKLSESGGVMNTTEFDRYFHELNCQEYDILTWWKMNGPRFPILARMACDVLAIPVTTVPSKSALSTGGHTIDQFRSSLSPKMIEALICTQDWIRADLRFRENGEVVWDELERYIETEKI